jgi:hypothetical protein
VNFSSAGQNYSPSPKPFIHSDSNSTVGCLTVLLQIHALGLTYKNASIFKLLWWLTHMMMSKTITGLLTVVILVYALMAS